MTGDRDNPHRSHFAGERNGHAWPELPAEPPSLDELPENPSIHELARSYATAILAFAPLWRRSVHALEFLYGATMATKAEIEILKRLVSTVRPEHESSHDFSEDFARADALLRGKLKDPRDPMTSDRAKAIAESAFHAAMDGEELATWRRVKSLPVRVGWKALEVMVTLAVGGAAAELAHWLAHR